MPKLVDRNPASAPGDWYIDHHCIDCTASREVAPGLIIHRQGKSVFARQPANAEEELAAWRAVMRPWDVAADNANLSPRGQFDTREAKTAP